MTVAARIAACFLAAVLAAAAASAQDPLFAVDDFVAPSGDGPIFVSRVIAGVAVNPSDHYRPLEQDALFVHVANSLYWSNFQLDYERSEVRGSEDSGDADVQTCRCSPPVYFPTPPPRDATPAPPLPGSRDTVQFGWYRRRSIGEGSLPIVLRSRATYTHQRIDTTVTSAVNGAEMEQLSGSEQSFGIDSDVTFTIRGRRVFGSLIATHTKRTHTTDNRAQTALGYTARFPAIPLGRVLLRATVAVAAVSGRGSTGPNVVHPAFEAFWHDRRTGVNVHLIWSALGARDGVQGWQTEHQIAFFADYPILTYFFEPR